MKITRQIPGLPSDSVDSAKPRIRESPTGKEFRVRPKSTMAPLSINLARGDMDPGQRIAEVVAHATAHLVHRVDADGLAFIRATLRDHLETDSQMLDLRSTTPP